jgi:hypothetical protein
MLILFLFVNGIELVIVFRLAPTGDRKVPVCVFFWASNLLFTFNNRYLCMNNILHYIFSTLTFHILFFHFHSTFNVNILLLYILFFHSSFLFYFFILLFHYILHCISHYTFYIQLLHWDSTFTITFLRTHLLFFNNQVLSSRILTF